jgi:hypothetical protein
MLPSIFFAYREELERAYAGKGSIAEDGTSIVA